MTEFHTVKRIDNSRVIRPANPEVWRQSWRLATLGLALAAVVLLYAWQHFQCLQLGYQLEELKAMQSQAVELNQQLHLEIESLRSPMRIDVIARRQLGLTVPLPGQVAPVEPGASSELAQARAVTSTPAQ